MERIIADLIEQLTNQRNGVLIELQDLNPAHMNYAVKKNDLQQEIITIDQQINNHLGKLDLFYINQDVRNSKKAV